MGSMMDQMDGKGPTMGGEPMKGMMAQMMAQKGDMMGDMTDQFGGKDEIMGGGTMMSMMGEAKVLSNGGGENNMFVESASARQSRRLL
eukprot:12727520-Heterocapsa_arctica.AAC.1